MLRSHIICRLKIYKLYNYDFYYEYLKVVNFKSIYGCKNYEHFIMFVYCASYFNAFYISITVLF